MLLGEDEATLVNNTVLEGNATAASLSSPAAGYSRTATIASSPLLAVIETGTAKAKMCDGGHFARSIPAVKCEYEGNSGGRHDCSCEKDRYAAHSMVCGISEKKQASLSVVRARLLRQLSNSDFDPPTFACPPERLLSGGLFVRKKR
jgi:hypothetical protein